MRTAIKHSPTPWQLGYPGEESPDSMGTVYTVDKAAMSYEKGGECFAKAVARLHWGCSCCDSGAESMPDEDRANAEHIVKCVNVHDELVEALQGVTSILQAFSCTAQLSKIRSESLEKAAQAIAKVNQ